MAQPKTLEAVAQENASIQEALEEAFAAATAYADINIDNVGKPGISEIGDVSQAQRTLVTKANKLLQAARGPVNMIFSHFENIAHAGSLRALIDMGVFDAMPRDGEPITAEDLSQKLGVDRELLVRFMRNATSAGPFEEVGPEEYTHTPYSLLYLVPELRAIFSFYIDDFMTACAKASEFFQKQAWKNTATETNNPYTYAHNVPQGMTMWNYIDQIPSRLANLNKAMIAQTSATMLTVNIYPFEDELKKLDTDDDTVLLVDVGGGMGQATRHIRHLCKDIKGKMVLQDRKEVVASITEDMEGIEVMEHDFFTPQPVKGALIYHIRRCLHDWPTTECIKILQNIAAAMAPPNPDSGLGLGLGPRSGSRLLISEIVLPAQNADVDASAMDLTAMCAGGMERTEAQWRDVLDAAGLVLGRVFGVRGTSHAVLEGWLKG